VPVGACLTECDLIANTGCPAPLDCVIVQVLGVALDGVVGASCSRAGTLDVGAACQRPLDCRVGAACVDGVCLEICEVATATCGGGGRCRTVDPPVLVNDRNFGFCTP
jgi:hypothetical protein